MAPEQLVPQDADPRQRPPGAAHRALRRRRPRHRGVLSFSVWETEGEARTAVELARTWVAEHLAERIKLREEHTGDISWDEAL